jgi:Outer membrane receptor proteins, mostly Fe transport
MKHKILYVLPLILVSIMTYSQDKVTLSGTITDGESNETLIGVNVYFPDAMAGTTTNEYGFFSITLPKGDYTLNVSYLGYTTIQEQISLVQNIRKDYVLAPESNALDEVVVTSDQPQTNIRKPEMSVSKLSINTIKKMPAMMGEVDVLKSLLQVPGVTNAQEGASGFNVRGGSVDGNLVLLDEAVVYNTSHLFGFFSVFNSDVIKDMKLYKGGIPANFGGRISSVLDIYQKEGNNKEFHMSGGIGLIASRLLVEGPIQKDRSSFVVAGRSSYIHLLLQLADEPNSLYFYDLNAKLNYKLNDNNNIFLSGYFGKDYMDFNKSLINTYGNSLFNLRWNHIFSDKLFSNASAIYSVYDYGIKVKFAGVDWTSQINNYNFKYDFKHYLSSKFVLEYGVNSIYYQFNPGTLKPFGENSSVNQDQLAKKYAFENALYISADHRLSEEFALTYGLRYSNFMRLGEEEVFTYANNRPLLFNQEFQVYEEASSNGSLYYGKNKKIAGFNNFEPRLSMAYSLDENQSIKASYNRMSQYIHLISNTASATPLDVWAPSDQYLKPEILDQVALGYFRNLKQGDYSLEMEAFYKTVKNKADYIDGADLIAKESIERVLLNGEARSYGLELMARKNTGKLTGWLSYTLSKAEQRTPGRDANEPGINNGDWYRANYDKRHNLSLTASYELTPKWSFGGIFTYQSGKAATFPNGKYQYNGITVPSYGTRNGSSLSAYHHLDLSATYTPKPEKTKGWRGEWVFSVYNAYGRSNASGYTFGQNEDTGLSEVRRLSIFGIVPSVTYNFKF